jgi:hypothetical protein
LIIEITLSGFLFLLILVLALVIAALGYLWEKDDYDPDADLQKINKNPKKFKKGFLLALVHNGCVITLSILLFIAFSPYNIVLGIVWTIVRIGEGVILSYNDIQYWGFLKIAKQYSGASDVEKNALSDSARTIFKAKDSRFKFAMILWAIGTLAFSIVLVTSGVVPAIIGWLGILASILVGTHNGLKLAKHSSKILSIVGALFAILFEIILGGWLLFY